MSLTPDFDGYRDDDAPEVLAETFAGSVADVQGGRRFVGGLFREDALDENADDADLEWLHGYTEDDPGSLGDVLNTFGPGLYRIRTAPGFPATTGRRITVQVGRRKAVAPVAPTNLHPTVPPANLDRIRREEREAARTDVEYEKEGLSREVRRLKLEASDAEETLARARREADRLAAEGNTLREALAVSQAETITARRALADEAMRNATATAEAARESADEIDGYRAELAELKADRTVLDFQLASARRGEGIPETNPLADLAREALPHLGGVFSGIAARLAAGAETPGAAGAPDTDAGYAMPTYPSAAPSPSPMQTPSAFSGDGSAGLPDAPPFDALTAGVSGDGAAGLDARFTQNPAIAPVVERPELADVATLDPGSDGEPGPLVAIAHAVLSVMQGVAQVTPAEIARLVEAGQAAGTEAADWRELVSDLVGEAVRTKAAPEPLADILAPLFAPYRAEFAQVFEMPDVLAVPLVMHGIGVKVPKGGKAYLGRFLTALKARI